jgi:hypothetical protein
VCVCVTRKTQRGTNMARQGKARQGKARQGKARQGKAMQGNARYGMAHLYVQLRMSVCVSEPTPLPPGIDWRAYTVYCSRQVKVG